MTERSNINSEAPQYLTKKISDRVRRMSTEYPDFWNYLLPIFAIIGFVVVTIAAIFATRRGKLFEDLFKKRETKESQKKPVTKDVTSPTQTRSNLALEDLEKIRAELRVMNVEKEIIGYALTRLYEAEAEGKLNEKDRELLLDKYSREMYRIDRESENKQMIVKLHDLEETKADLVKMFHTKLDEISRSIENIKLTLGIAPIDATQTTVQTPQPAEPPSLQSKDVAGDKSVSKPKPKSKAEEKIEAIQEEVLKVLERLEQIETEG